MIVKICKTCKLPFETFPSCANVNCGECLVKNHAKKVMFAIKKVIPVYDIDKYSNMKEKICKTCNETFVDYVYNKKANCERCRKINRER